jgi:hypothetical protein
MSILRDAIIEGMARTLWALGWADALEELGQTKRISGRRIEDVMPPVPAMAERAAKIITKNVERVNGVSVDDLYARAVLADEQAGTRTEGSPYAFGSDLALMVTGHGVSWFDDHADFPLTVPHDDSVESELMMLALDHEQGEFKMENPLMQPGDYPAMVTRKKTYDRLQKLNLRVSYANGDLAAFNRKFGNAHWSDPASRQLFRSVDIATTKVSGAMIGMEKAISRYTHAPFRTENPLPPAVKYIGLYALLAGAAYGIYYLATRSSTYGAGAGSGALTALDVQAHGTTATAYAMRVGDVVTLALGPTYDSAGGNTHKEAQSPPATSVAHGASPGDYTITALAPGMATFGFAVSSGGTGRAAIELPFVVQVT